MRRSWWVCHVDRSVAHTNWKPSPPWTSQENEVFSFSCKVQLVMIYRSNNTRKCQMFLLQSSLVVLSWITRERSIPKFSSSTEVPMPWKLRFSHFHQPDKTRSFCVLEQVTTTPEQIARMGVHGPGKISKFTLWFVHVIGWRRPPGLSIDCVCTTGANFSLVFHYLEYFCDVVVGDILGNSVLCCYFDSRRKSKEI